MQLEQKRLLSPEEGAARAVRRTVSAIRPAADSVMKPVSDNVMRPVADSECNKASS